MTCNRQQSQRKATNVALFSRNRKPLLEFLQRWSSSAGAARPLTAGATSSIVGFRIWAAVSCRWSLIRGKSEPSEHHRRCINKIKTSKTNNSREGLPTADTRHTFLIPLSGGENFAVCPSIIIVILRIQILFFCATRFSPLLGGNLSHDRQESRGL